MYVHVESLSPFLAELQSGVLVLLSGLSHSLTSTGFLATRRHAVYVHLGVCVFVCICLVEKACVFS